MPRFELGSPQEAELTAIVLEKLTEIGWADSSVLANFIVVMVANEKSKEDIVTELTDILPDHAAPFADWLFDRIDGAPQTAAVTQEQPQHEADFGSSDADFADTNMGSSGARDQSDPRAPSRLLLSAISSATRADPAAPVRQAPARVYDNERRDRDRRASRDQSVSPTRSREGITTRSKDDRIRFRRTSQERSRDEARINARLGTPNDEREKPRGRGRIEDRLGKKGDGYSPRNRSRDGNNYHERRNNNNRQNALRDIESRLGSRLGPANDESDNVPTQPASWSKNPSRMSAVEAEYSRQSRGEDTGKPSRCKFWPNCSQGDNCQYWHPRELCQAYPNCPNTAATCMYVHPLAEPTAEQAAAAARQALMQSMRGNAKTSEAIDTKTGTMDGPLSSGPTECKFGVRCTRADCKFRHTERDAPKQQPCRFFPHCTKPNCPFYHPPYGETLSAQDTSMDESGSNGVAGAAVKLSTPCKFGDFCTRPGCHFTHPRDGGAANAPLCKFNPCTRPGCIFRHIPGGATGGHKTLVLNGGRPHMSDRFGANSVVDESQVEKLHVPASSHWANGGVSHQPDESTIAAAEAQAAADMDMDVEL